MAFVVAFASALAIAVGAAGSVGAAGDTGSTGATDDTTTTVQAVPGASGAAVTVTVDGGVDAPTGSVTILDDGRAVAVLPLHGGAATLRTTALDDGVVHTLTATYAGDPEHAASVSRPVDVGPPGAASASASSGAGVVSVAIPAGALTVTAWTTPASSRWPFAQVTSRAVVTDTRAGDLGFSVTVGLAADGGPLALVTGVHAEQVPGNALQAVDVRVAPVGLAVRGHQLAVARYLPGLGLGSVGLGCTVTSPAPVRVVWTVV